MFGRFLFVGALVTSLVLGASVSKAADVLPWVKGSTTVAVLPDTQVYVMKHPELFIAQTKWIAEHAQERNIVYVLHLGDIVNNNNKPQWKVAQRAMSQLDGVVPYAVAPGNHDYGPGGNAATRDTLLNEYFPVQKYEKWPTFGGVFEQEKLDNSFHTFRIGQQDWLVLALEWGPRDAVVNWAERVLQKHPRHKAILITHAYLYFDGTRYDHTQAQRQSWNPHWYKTPGGVNDGEELWQKLVKRHPQMMLTLNGHVLGDGLAYLKSRGDHGNVVHQMLVNYQMKPRGGEGYLRLIEFLPDGETVQIKAYSPPLDKYKTDKDNQFSLKLQSSELAPAPQKPGDR